MDKELIRNAFVKTKTQVSKDNEQKKTHHNERVLISLKNVTKEYKGRMAPAIDSISFNVYAGHFHAFIGANGAGKTTTIKAIIGAYSKHRMDGTILIDNIVNTKLEAKRKIGYVPEKAIFPKKVSALEYLSSMALLSGFSIKDSKKLAKNLLIKTGLIQLSKKSPNSFSSGQKKKMLLAQAMIHDPEILIMDEPAANLDPLAREDLFRMLTELQKQGKAIFISSHILDEIGKYTTYATILDGGKIVFSDFVDSKTELSTLYKKYVVAGSVDTFNF